MLKIHIMGNILQVISQELKIVRGCRFTTYTVTNTQVKKKKKKKHYNKNGEFSSLEI